MVKRIKKRIPKQTSEVEARPPESAESLDGQLDQLAEDEFTQYTANIFKWVLRHRVAILSAVAIALVSVVAVSVVSSSRRVGRERAAAAFQEAATAYAQALEPTSTGFAPPGGADPAEAQARQARLEKARAGFDAVLKEHGDQPVRGLATLGRASVDFDLGKPADAVPQYDEVLAHAGRGPFERAIVLQAKAAALEMAGKPDEAVEAWRAVEAVDKATYGLGARLAVGRILEAKGDAAAAKQTYEQARKDFSDVLDLSANRPHKAELDRRLASLGSDA